MNRWAGIGTLTAKPVLMAVEDGKKKYTRFQMVCRNQREHDIVQIAVWGGKAVMLTQDDRVMLEKGDMLGIAGPIKTSKFEKNNEGRVMVEVRGEDITFLGKRIENKIIPIPESTLDDLNNFDITGQDD